MSQMSLSAPSLSASALVVTSPGGVTSASSQTVTGLFAGPAGSGVAGTVVTLDDDGAALGTAVVARDGTWSSDVVLRHLGANAITAQATDAAGLAVASAPVTLTLATVLSPPSGGLATATPADLPVHPAHGATLSAAGAATTFVFTAHPGHDTVTGFGLSGAGADRLSFSDHSFAGLADLLRHATLSGDGAVIHLSPRDSVTLVGVTRQELRSHPEAFAFHP